MLEQTFVETGSVQCLEDLGAEQRAALTAAILADSLDAIGLRDQVCLPGLVELTLADRVLGRASTIRFAPTEEDTEDPYGEAAAFIDSLQPGEVPIVSAGDDRTAYWGELFSAAAMGRGAAGTLVDGPVRDVAKVIELTYPVFSVGRRPVDFRARMRVVDRYRPVRVAGVVVGQGDLVLADADGVVVVPGRVEAEVLGRALDRARDEGQVRDALLAGARLDVVWQRWGVL